MPIETDTTKFSIDFNYEWVAPDGQKYTFQMKFLHGIYGPTIQIANGEYDPLALPADMFCETSDFLRKQGVMGGGLPAKTVPTIGGRGLGVPSLNQGARRPTTGGVPSAMPGLSALIADQQQEQQEEQPAEPKTKLTAEAIMKERAMAKAKAKGDARVKSDHKRE